MPDIRVHERALAHLSRGLYRSPASALRELVSNAWDANATRVDVDTNYPNFFQLSIEDNGDGFSKEDFKNLMEGGIGNSGKRVEEKHLRFGRPTIGRLGIGMLGIAQICGSFVVTSKPLKGEPFRARIKLYDQAKLEMDKPDSKLVHEAVTKVDGEELPGKIVDVGTYEFIDVGKNVLVRGTRILADDVTPTFTRAFQESLTLDGYKPIPMEWKSAITKVLRKSSSLQLLGDYWRLLWELSASCPVPYVAGDAVPKGVVKALNARLESYNFSLFVDGRQLFKPIYLKKNEGGYTTKIMSAITKRVYGRDLKFSGYIAVQEGAQLRPDELRGILVRIKNVGIGYFDPSLLDFRVNHGPRSRWVTGEVFVEQGLEDALNVDRDSFNRFHPEFRALQEYVHNFLQTEIFPDVYRKLEVRSKDRRQEKKKKRDQALRQVLRDKTSQHVKVSKRDLSTDKKSDADYSSAHRDDSGGIEIGVANAEDLPTSKTSQHLARSILTIFELALLENGRQAQREKFSELLFALLKSW
jgi:hypothetical protein